MSKKILAAAILHLLFSCENGNSDKKHPKSGQSIFKQYCVLCHGANGKLGVNGAKDLTASPLALDERIQVITYGRNNMTPYKGLLTDEEIRAVAEYTLSLK